jgi:hypothetical protein
MKFEAHFIPSASSKKLNSFAWLSLRIDSINHHLG